MLKTDLGLGQKQSLLYSTQTATSIKGQTLYLKNYSFTVVKTAS